MTSWAPAFIVMLNSGDIRENLFSVAEFEVHWSNTIGTVHCLAWGGGGE